MSLSDSQLEFTTGSKADVRGLFPELFITLLPFGDSYGAGDSLVSIVNASSDYSVYVRDLLTGGCLSLLKSLQGEVQTHGFILTY